MEAKTRKFPPERFRNGHRTLFMIIPFVVDEWLSIGLLFPILLPIIPSIYKKDSESRFVRNYFQANDFFLSSPGRHSSKSNDGDRLDPQFCLLWEGQRQK
jgi:hypothetical protein